MRVGGLIMIFSHIGQAWESAATSLVSGSIANIISAITPVITTGIAIYFMITGYMVLAGRIQEPIGDVLIKATKLIIVATVFTQAGSLAVNGVNGIESMFTSAITGGTSSVYAVLDDNLNAGADAVNQLNIALENLEGEGMLDMPPIASLVALLLTMVITAISTILITVLAAAIYIMTKTALAVVLALSPFFIAGLFFPVTARWFDSWLSQAINYALTGAIIVFFSTLAFLNFSEVVNAIVTEVNNDVYFPSALIIQLVIYAVVSFFAMKQAPSIASGLAGGIGVSGVSLVGMAVAAKQAALYGFKSAKIGGHAATGGMFTRTTKRDHNTGRNVSSSRFAHLREGRTMLNSTYRQAMMDRMKNGWSSNNPRNSIKRK